MRFVEGDGAGGRRGAPIDESRREFWDDFASIGERRNATAASGGGSSTLGTAAMGKGRKKDDEWDW